MPAWIRSGAAARRDPTGDDAELARLEQRVGRDLVGRVRGDEHARQEGRDHDELARLGTELSVIDRDLAALQRIWDRFSCVTTLISSKRNIERSVAFADVLVGAVLNPGQRAPVLVTRQMVQSMKPRSLIMDISIDEGGCVETSHPTTHEHPTYVEEGVLHYCVPNMPGAVARTATHAFVNSAMPYISEIAANGLEAVLNNPSIEVAVNTYDGETRNLSRLASVKEKYDKLIAEGKFTRSWLGIGIRGLAEDSELKRMLKNVAEGVVVASIVPDGPAAKSDLKPGDVITVHAGAYRELTGSGWQSEWDAELPSDQAALVAALEVAGDRRHEAFLLLINAVRLRQALNFNRRHDSVIIILLILLILWLLIVYVPSPRAIRLPAKLAHFLEWFIRPVQPEAPAVLPEETVLIPEKTSEFVSRPLHDEIPELVDHLSGSSHPTRLQSAHFPNAVLLVASIFLACAAQLTVLRHAYILGIILYSLCGVGLWLWSRRNPGWMDLFPRQIQVSRRLEIILSIVLLLAIAFTRFYDLKYRVYGLEADETKWTVQSWYSAILQVDQGDFATAHYQYLPVSFWVRSAFLRIFGLNFLSARIESAFLSLGYFA